MSSSEVDPFIAANAGVLSFDASRIRSVGGAILKQTSSGEYEAILAATTYLDDVSLDAAGIPVQVAPVIGFTPAAEQDGGELRLAHCQGENIEIQLRRALAEGYSGDDMVALIRSFISNAVEVKFGWGDFAPRNMILDDAGPQLTLVDFERESRFGTTDKAWWARTLHGYGLEELSCLLPHDQVMDILGPYVDQAHEPAMLDRGSISSRRKLALLQVILGDHDSGAVELPTEAVRLVERYMALVAQPVAGELSERIPMDYIEEQIMTNGVSWYVGHVLQRFPELGRHSAIFTTGHESDREQDLVTITSPSGYNTVHLEVLQDGRRAYHIECPPVTIYLPDEEGVYAPTKTAADIAALLNDYYSGGLSGRSALELGCGDHAVIAHSMRALGARNVMATDIDPKAVDLVSRYGSSDIAYRHSNLFSGIDSRYDVIVFNAPQMPMPAHQRAELPDWHDSPGDRGYETILQTIREAQDYMTEDGRLLIMMFDFLTTDGVIAQEAHDNGFSMRPIGTLIKPIRAGGQTKQSLDYIREVFPGLTVHEDNENGSYISATLFEFARASQS